MADELKHCEVSESSAHFEHKKSDKNNCGTLSFDLPTYIPQNFQGPAQLFHLKCVQFYRLRSVYRCTVSAMETQCSKMIGVEFACQTALVGFSCDSFEYPFAKEVTNGSNDLIWRCNLLCSLFDASRSILLDANWILDAQRQTRKTNTLVLLDKLDLSELLNFLIFQNHSEVQSRCGVDLDRLDAETQQFELLYPLLLDSIDNVSISLYNVLSSLVQVSGHTYTHFNEVKEALLEHPYWMHSMFLKAFLQVLSPDIIQHDQDKQMNCFRLRNSSPSVFLLYKSGGNSFPSALLKWYVQHTIGQLAESGDFSNNELQCKMSQVLNL